MKILTRQRLQVQIKGYCKEYGFVSLKHCHPVGSCFFGGGRAHHIFGNNVNLECSNQLNTRARSCGDMLVTTAHNGYSALASLSDKSCLELHDYNQCKGGC